MSNSRRESWFSYLVFVAVLAIVYMGTQRGLFATGTTDFADWFHALDSILNSFLFPLCFFLGGFGYIRLKQESSTRGFYFFLIDKLLYTFVAWTILQGLIATIFSGYTGSAKIVSDIYFELFFEPRSHLRLLPAMALCYLAMNLLDRLARLEGFALTTLFAVSFGGFLLATEEFNIYPWSYLPNYFLYFLLGYIFYKYFDAIEQHRLTFVAIGLILAITSQYLFHGYFDLESYDSDNKLLFLIASSSIFALAAIFLMFDTAKLPFSQLLNTTSTILFLSYAMFANGMREILRNSFSVTDSNTLLICCILFSVLSALALCAMQRQVPILGLAFGLSEKFSSGTLYRSTKTFLSSHKLLRYATATAFAAVISVPLLINFFVYQDLKSMRVDPVSNSLQLRTDQDSIVEGERLARVFGCYLGCHGNLGGGILLRSPLDGISAPPNLTKSMQKYSVSDLDNIVRQGVWPDGTPMTNLMPSAGYNSLSDEQFIQIISFLKQVPEIKNTPAKSTMGIGKKLDFLKGNLELEFEKVEDAKEYYARTHEDYWAGQSLARAACGECHGHRLEGIPALLSPPLIIAKAYSLEQFTNLMRTGTKFTGEDAYLMSLVSPIRFSNLTDTEIGEIYNYLISL